MEETLKEQEVLRLDSRHRSSLAFSRPRFSSSILACFSSREEDSLWLSYRADAMDSLSTLRRSRSRAQSSVRVVTMGT